MKIEFSIQQLSKITGKKTDELETLLKGEEGEPLENAPGLIAEMVGDRIKEAKDTEFNKAKPKLAKSLESIVKTAGIEDFEDVESAVRQLAEKASEKGQDGSSIDLETLKPSQLAKIPAFVTYRDAQEAKIQQLQADFDKQVKAQKAATVSAKAKEKALQILTEKQAKFTNPEKQLSALFKMLGAELDMDDKGNIIVLGEDGEPLVDAKTQNRIEFDDLVVSEWEPLFGFNQIDPNKKTPTPPPGKKPVTDQQKQGIKFDSWDDANKAIKTEVNASRRVELMKAMNEQFPNGKPAV